MLPILLAPILLLLALSAENQAFPQTSLEMSDNVYEALDHLAMAEEALSRRGKVRGSKSAKKANSKRDFDNPNAKDLTKHLKDLNMNFDNLDKVLWETIMTLKAGKSAQGFAMDAIKSLGGLSMSADALSKHFKELEGKEESEYSVKDRVRVVYQLEQVIIRVMRTQASLLLKAKLAESFKGTSEGKLETEGFVSELGKFGEDAGLAMKRVYGLEEEAGLISESGAAERLAKACLDLVGHLKQYVEKKVEEEEKEEEDGSDSEDAGAASGAGDPGDSGNGEEKEEDGTEGDSTDAEEASPEEADAGSGDETETTETKADSDSGDETETKADSDSDSDAAEDSGESEEAGSDDEADAASRAESSTDDDPEAEAILESEIDKTTE